MTPNEFEIDFRRVRPKTPTKSTLARAPYRSLPSRLSPEAGNPPCLRCLNKS